MLLIPGHSYRGELPLLAETEEAVSARLRCDVVFLADTIGERNTDYPEGLTQAEDFISSRFRELGYGVRLETYSAGGMAVANVEATLTGQGNSDEILVVGGHYDSVPGTPGADDNASGVAVLLEIARHFSFCRLERTIHFVAFVNEEPPYFQTEQMGSHVYARGCLQRKEKIVGMLCLESLGYFSPEPRSQSYPAPLDKLYPTTADFITFCGNISSGSLLRDCVESFRATTPFPSESLIAPEGFFSIGWSDHWAFWQAGYPAIMITDTAFLRNPHYHRKSDVPEHLDYDRMTRVAEGLKHVVTRLALEK